MTGTMVSQGFILALHVQRLGGSRSPSVTGVNPVTQD